MDDISPQQTEYYDINFKNLEHPAGEFKSFRFEECGFESCDFSAAMFSRCQFVDCRFIRCNISNIKVSYSRFTDVVFEECKAIGVDWTQADWPRFTSHATISFIKSVINDTTFYGLALEELTLEECKAQDVDFREANLNGANFSFSDFTNALFSQTCLTRVDFTDAVNYQIDIYQNEIKGAKFSRYEAVSLLDSLDIELLD